jgi:hypothetical protein
MHLNYRSFKIQVSGMYEMYMRSNLKVVFTWINVDGSRLLAKVDTILQPKGVYNEQLSTLGDGTCPRDTYRLLIYRRSKQR